MRRVIKLGLWLLPLVGLAVGYGYAYLRYYGLLEPLHLVGNPGNDLAQIVGTRGGRELLVATEGGAIYGLEFHNGERAVLPVQPTWVLAGEEPTHTAGRVHHEFADIDARRPGFEPEQLYI